MGVLYGAFNASGSLLENSWPTLSSNLSSKKMIAKSEGHHGRHSGRQAIDACP